MIKQQIVQKPIYKKVNVTRPVYTEREVRGPKVETETLARSVPVMMPGKQIFKEQEIRPYEIIKQEKLNIQKGQPREIEQDPVVKPV